MALTHPMRILHVVESMEPGGLENGIVNVARCLDPRRFDIWVACLGTAGSFADRLPKPEQAITLEKPPGLSPGTVLKLARTLRAVKPDILHTHDLGPLIYGAAGSWGGLQVPLLHGEHCQLSAEERLVAKRWLRKFLYLLCRRVHTVSDALRSDLITLGFNPRRLTSIPNGVDTERFKPGTAEVVRRQLSLPADGRILGIVARLRPEKRHTLLLGAFALLAPRYPDLTLLIVGDGPDLWMLRNMAESLGLSHRIRFVGHQDNPVPFYQALDLMVLPSVGEGLSNAVLEAMACGIPVLASPACGNADVIRTGENGFLAAVDTAETLAVQLEKLLKAGGAIREVGRRARLAVLERFSVARMAQAYDRLYSDVSAGRV